MKTVLLAAATLMLAAAPAKAADIDINTLSVVLGTTQNAAAIAVTPPGSPKTAEAVASITQAAGLVSQKLNNVGNGSEINTGMIAADVAQNAAAVAIGVALAQANINQFVGVISNEVN